MILEGVSVVDMSDHLSGLLASQVLRDWGARVVHLEPAGGGAVARGTGSFRLTGDDELRATLFALLTDGKRTIELGPEQGVADAQIRALLEDADIVLAGNRSDADAVAAINPSAVITVPADFPAGSRYSSWVGSEMIHQALSGAMFTTGSAERQPLFGLGHRAYHAAGWTAVISIMGAMLAREHSGQGQVVEVSVYESCAAMAQNLVTQYSYSGTWPTRLRYDGMVSTIRCQDGWVVLFAYLHWPTICRAFDVLHLVDDPRFQDIESRARNWDELAGLLQDAAHDLNCDRIVEIAQQGKVAVSKVNTLEDIVGRPYYEERLWVSAPSGSRPEIPRLQPAFFIEDLDPPQDAEPVSPGGGALR
ncbi:CoA transferase [Saccharopolyspora shandongensis]|uniref:CoA transferase n=1 Tax=Saccharopolyspora shandongensis TaxID=418495 RepID=UPI0033D70876